MPTTPLRHAWLLVVVAWLPVSTASALDAAPWDSVLRAHAHRGGVDYAALKADPEAMANLDRFLGAVATMPAEEPLASWLNAYNALVVKAVVDRYPLATVRDVPGFFDRVRHRVAGSQRTLDDLEHRVIRVRFPDARVHAALNCGARSCPALHPRAFQRRGLDSTLDRLARRMVQSSTHVRVRDGRLEGSKLFEWFRDDFVRDGGSVVGWIRRYDEGGRITGISDDATVHAIRYDWRLNDRPR